MPAGLARLLLAGRGAASGRGQLRAAGHDHVYDGRPDDGFGHDRRADFDVNDNSGYTDAHSTAYNDNSDNDEVWRREVDHDNDQYHYHTDVNNDH